jgi:hypothetical protein
MLNNIDFHFFADSLRFLHLAIYFQYQYFINRDCRIFRDIEMIFHAAIADAEPPPITPFSPMITLSLADMTPLFHWLFSFRQLPFFSAAFGFSIGFIFEFSPPLMPFRH